MKRISVLSLLFALVIIFSSAIQKVHKSAGPPSCSAGEPPNKSNCTNCHNDGLVNTGSADILFDVGGADTAFVPGKTYTISIAVSKPGMRRAGFQCIALQNNDDRISPGTVTLTDKSRTQLLDKNSPHSGGCLEEERVWIEHTYAGNSSNDSGVSRWSYQWTAPTNGTGPITFYLAALEANNDLSETGDMVYTRTTTISGLPVGLNDLDNSPSFIVYHTPALGELNIISNEPLEEIRLYNAAGKLLATRNKNISDIPSKTVKISIPTIPSGIYFLYIQSTVGYGIKKVFIQ